MTPLDLARMGQVFRVSNRNRLGNTRFAVHVKWRARKFELSHRVASRPSDS